MLFYHWLILDINQYFVRLCMHINITAGRNLGKFLCKIYYTSCLIACQHSNCVSACTQCQSSIVCHFSAHFPTDGIHPQWKLKIQQTAFASKETRQKNKANLYHILVNLFLYKWRAIINQPTKTIWTHMLCKIICILKFWRVTKVLLICWVMGKVLRQDYEENFWIIFCLLCSGSHFLDLHTSPVFQTIYALCY